MAIAVLGGFVLVVMGLTLLSRRHGAVRQACCAPTDPADDLRMRPAFDSEPIEGEP
ncbi:hypothetical protein [Nocardioides sp.]|uniref:hypothetical protein n=1 Tax=Nocardioides sp. TaxID=35761 RepID=UPI00286BAEC9|nr:hypothetical protein [Nocardioides sp.]